jgi:diguanylate cyclase (GGDEF)-like protein/PAS domain S-box-containing protein
MPSELEREQEALLQFLYLAPVGLVQTTLDGAVQMVNPLSAQLLLPLAREASLDNLFDALDRVAPDLRQRVADFGDDIGTICDALQLHVSGAHSGTRSALVLSLTLLKLDQERLMAVLSDVTAAVCRDRELRQSQAWVDAMVNGQADFAVVPVDDQGFIAGWDAESGRLTGYTAAQVLGQHCSMLCPCDVSDEATVAERLREADDSGWSLDEGWRQRADGSHFWGNCMIAPQPPLRTRGRSDAALSPGSPDSTACRYNLVLRDASARRDASQALRQSLWCDHLTGLANRRAFFEAAAAELDRAARSGRPLSVALVDADRFKQINDGHGHAAGDAALRQLARNLEAGFRPSDTVARIGGEEFAVLLLGSDAEAAEAAAARLCQAVAARPVVVDGQSIALTVSVGVATLGDGAQDLDSLLQRADAALYQAKSDGRNRVRRSGGAPASAQPVH